MKNTFYIYTLKGNLYFIIFHLHYYLLPLEGVRGEDPSLREGLGGLMWLLHHLRHLRHLCRPHAADHLHHLTSLVELLDELVYLLHVGA